MSFRSIPLVLLLSGTAAAVARDRPTVLTTPEQRQSFRTWTTAQADVAFARWRSEYEQLKTPERIAERGRRLRGRFVAELGGWPERTPLNARVTGTLAGAGFTVENVLLESRPHHHVTGNLYLPDPAEFPGTVPAVLVPCGHADAAKAYGLYQAAGQLLALHGIAGFVFDPIDQGERHQLLGDDGQPIYQGTTGHTNFGVMATLAGTNTAAFEVWDGMRCIDYLQGRPEIDGDRIGCTGNSGGGTQTSYLMALDDRIGPAAPSCYVTRFERLLATIGPQDAEQNVHGQLAWGMDHPDYLIVRAPKPTLVCCVTQDFFDVAGTWSAYRDATRVFSTLGASERLDIVEIDRQHGYHRPIRERVVQFMVRWLRGELREVTEPDGLEETFTAEQLRVTPEGRTMKLPGARSVYDVVADGLPSEYPPVDAATVREVAGIRPLADLPMPTVTVVDEKVEDGRRVRRLILEHADGILLPALESRPADVPADAAATLVVHEDGFAADFDPDVYDGPVLQMTLRGTGETTPEGGAFYDEMFGADGNQVMVAYLLGRSVVGMRAEDVLVGARFVGEGRPVRLVATGHVAVPALHAAVAEPDLFAAITLRRTLMSWRSLLRTRRTANQLVNMVHGALRRYDLPDLRAALGDKLRSATLVDGVGEPTRDG